MEAGKRLREAVPRASHGTWKKPAGRADPIAMLQASDPERLAELLPVRYGRMLVSPFTFYRGAAGVMAADLANTPATGLRVQACGDCHLLNFGGFATPERNIIFDINDFDETLPAPWEWDVKRLAASFVLAARANGLSDGDGRDAAEAAARSYRKRLAEYAQMPPLEVWYARIDDEDVLSLMSDPDRRAMARKRIAKAVERSASALDFPQLAGMVGGHVHIKDTPPLIFHPEDARAPDFMAQLEAGDGRLPRDTARRPARAARPLPAGGRGDQGGGHRQRRPRLLDRAVHVGRPTTRCSCSSRRPAQSVLEPYAGASAYPHHGQRVVIGQRLAQPASDVFLGWVTGPRGRQFYVRQLRDAKIKPLIETFDAETLTVFGKACGWALARSHAKAGDAWTISGYLGSKSDDFDTAMGRFALAYADQAEADHAALKAAVRAGRVQVLQEE